MVDFTNALAATVVFVFADDAKTPLGTGFVLGYPAAGHAGQFIPVVVTAKHVVGDRTRILVRFNLSTGASTAFVSYDLDAQRQSNDCWVHQDAGVDLILFRTQHFDQLKYGFVPLELVGTKALFTEHDIKPTDRVAFPSMLANFMGTTRNLPVIRDGTVALMPDEPIPLTYDVGSTKVTTQQELILLDATSIPGASGSPVFLWPGPRLVNNAFNIGGGLPILLGVMHGFYGSAREVLKIETTDAQTGKLIEVFAENSRIAIVFPAWRIREILDRPDFAARMAELAASIAPALPDPTTPLAASNPTV